MSEMLPAVGGPEWRPIPGFESTHEASSWGGIRTIARLSSNGRRLRSRLRRTLLHKGYRRLTLHQGGQQFPTTVHQLVCLTFHGPGDGRQVRHLDGDSLNNCADNLTWGTGTENNRDSVEHGTHKQANKTHCPAGHAYDEANTYVLPSRPRWRRCRTCKQIENRRRKRARVLSTRQA